MSKFCFEDSIDGKANVIISITSEDYDLLDVHGYISDFIEDLKGYFL